MHLYHWGVKGQEDPPIDGRVVGGLGGGHRIPRRRGLGYIVESRDKSGALQAKASASAAI